MPTHRQDHRQDDYQHGNCCKKHTNLDCLTRGNHIRRKICKNILKLSGAGSDVILPTRCGRDLFQGIFVDLPAEPTPASPSAELTEGRAKAAAKPKWILISTVHG